MRFSQAPLRRYRFKVILDDIILFTFGQYYKIYMLLTFQFNNYDMKQITSLYEISNYVIEQHITLTLPAWRCLFTVRIT